MTTAPPPASCIGAEHGCVMFDCLAQLWEWIDPPMPQTQTMDNKNNIPATQQPLTQQQMLMAHHVHANEQIYSHQHPKITTQITSPQPNHQQNGVMHQLLQNQYQSNMDARSPLLENRQELYGTGYNNEYARHYGANDNYNYMQSPQRSDTQQPDPNVNHELLQNMPKGYNAEVYKDYLKRNPPKDSNQIYQNNQYKTNVNQYNNKPYLPYSNRIGSQSNTELLKHQYNQIQQMKLQQQLHYQNQAQMHQQQTFAERQMLLQQIHGIQPPANLQNSIYSDESYGMSDPYGSRNDFKEVISPDIQKEVDTYVKNAEIREREKQNRQYQEYQYQTNQQFEYRDPEHYRGKVHNDISKMQSPPDFSNNQGPKGQTVGVVSPMKSSESSSPSVKSPSTESRRSSGGNQALRSPIAQRMTSAPVAMSGILYKQGSDGLKVWRKRWFVLSEYCLFYYKNQEEEKLLGSVLLPSYKVSACTAEDKVLRKFAFKLEHTNMRTYILAATDQENMLKWVKALNMAALMENNNEQPQKSEWTTAKTENEDEVPGPTYANAPPKPRRSNEGYNSPSPEIYDPNYDLLKTPASHYSKGTGNTRYHDHTYQTSPNTDPVYTRNPQSPPLQQQPHPTKRPYDTHNLSLPLTNTLTDKLDNYPSNLTMYNTNPQSPYFDNRNRNSQQHPTRIPEVKTQDQIYERRSLQPNPFLQNSLPEGTELSVKGNHVMQNINTIQQERSEVAHNGAVRHSSTNAEANYNKDPYGELNMRQSRLPSNVVSNERLLIDRRTPDAYGRSIAGQDKIKVDDYEDVYATYGTESEYGRSYNKPTSPPQIRDNSSNHNQIHSFSGPAILRRKKMQSCGIQPQVPRPHSADFLEYESRNERINKTVQPRNVGDPPRQPQRPKSSLDINSYYDPSSDRYYSEESYAQKMRQSAQYLQTDKVAPGSKNIQIPLEKYASGLAEKQLHSPYGHSSNNNYETEFTVTKNMADNLSYNSKYSENEALRANWTLKEKELDNLINKSTSVTSNNSSAAGYVKDPNRFDNSLQEGFLRSASARLPTSVPEKEGEKKVQQREESMKRLLEWKQRMLQSPLTRKTTPSVISLPRSLNQNRHSVRSADQYLKTKTHPNATYNSYSSDDEEKTTGSDLLKPRTMQAGRSIKENMPSPNLAQTETSHEPQPPIIKVEHISQIDDTESKDSNLEQNVYENMECKLLINCVEEDTSFDDCDAITKKALNEISINAKSENCESEDSEAESENQMEYTDDDLDEVLMNSDNENETKLLSNSNNISNIALNQTTEVYSKPETPPINTIEDHYLPMSPRKTSNVEPAHQIIIKNLSVFDQTLAHSVEDNPYVEMTLGNEDDGMQNYEVVCINNDNKPEPVYMELTNLVEKCEDIDKENSTEKQVTDTASNFADTKDHTLKRVPKILKTLKEEETSLSFKQSVCQKYVSDCSDADDEASKDLSLNTPFNRFSISDTFRPASYYLGGSSSMLDMQDSSDSEITSPTIMSDCSPRCDELSDEALSKYVLDKLDKSSLSHDNSILKMLANENQFVNTAKRKTTSLMIYGSKTSIHDTLSRGEKIRNSRASLTNIKSKTSDVKANLLSKTLLEHYNSNRSIETDSIISYNAERGSSRMSLESDISSKYEIGHSNISSEVTSLNESDAAVEIRHPAYNHIDLIKRRPLSDNSFFELDSIEINKSNIEVNPTNDLDIQISKLHSNEPLQRSPIIENNSRVYDDQNTLVKTCKDNVMKAAHLQGPTHVRCSSTPATGQISKSNCDTVISNLERQYQTITNHNSGYIGSQSSCSSVGLTTKSPISYYRKDSDVQTIINKNINKAIIADKVKDFEEEKSTLVSGNETNASSSTTGFHSRESSTEHSAPYYYSDLSSQEHINVLPTSHFLKNTNLHRKLNNQRRRGPFNKKNDISHIHNPLHNNQFVTHDSSYELAAAARSVSVEFLCAADKDPEIDIKNIYESTGLKDSKIPESMSNFMSTFGCKSNSNNSYIEVSFEKDILMSTLRRVSEPESLRIKSSTPKMTCLRNEFEDHNESSAYENLICQGDKLWDEDSLWTDNLRRVSHRHARSMDDLDNLSSDPSTSEQTNTTLSVCGMNSLKHNKKRSNKKISRNVTYVNSNIQSQILSSNCLRSEDVNNVERSGENDEYVSLAENSDIPQEHCDEGVYEQLAIETVESQPAHQNKLDKQDQVTINKKFEFDREKLRQWDLMSSGLLKGGSGVLRGSGAGVCAGVGETLYSMDSGADSASNEASLSTPGGHLNSDINSPLNQPTLSKKAYLGSNTSIGRNNRDANIPVRAVSPRVRWVEDKSPNGNYGSQQISSSNQNLNNLTTMDDPRIIRSPSRASQQPISAVSPRVRRATEQSDDLTGDYSSQQGIHLNPAEDIPTAGELLGRTHEELVLLLIQLRRRHTATLRAMDQCCAQISRIEECLSSLNPLEREESIKRLEQLKMQLMELEHQYQKSKPLVQLVDNMVKLGSLYNRPGSTVERLERNQRLRHKVLAEHAMEQQRWLENAAAGKSLETEAARVRVAELWALEQELSDEAAILQGMKTDKDTIESLLTGVRSKFGSMQLDSGPVEQDLEAELARVHAMLALNSKKLEQTVADNSRLERELMQLRRALHAQRQSPAPAHAPAAATALLEDEVSRVQQLVSALQRQRQELSRAVRHLTQQSRALQITQHTPGYNRRIQSSWQETNLDTGHTTDHGQGYFDYDMDQVLPPGHSQLNTPLYVETHESGVADMSIMSPMTSEDMHSSTLGNLSNVEKQEIKTVRIVKRESERRQRDRERSLQPMTDWSSTNIDQFLEEELITPTTNYSRSTSLPRTDFSKFEEYYSKPTSPPNYIQRPKETSMDLSPKFPSSPSLSTYDFSREISSLNSSYNRNYDRSYDRTVSISTQYINSPTDSARTLTNDPMSKTSSIASLSRSHVELSPIFKSEAAKQIMSEMTGDVVMKNGSLHRRQVPKEKRRHYTAPHHLSAKTLNEMPKDIYNQDKMGRSLDDTDMERALRAPPDVVRSAIAPQRYAENTIDQLLAAPQKILIPERYIPEKPPELSPEEQQKRQEKVESIKKMLSSSSADPSKSPEGEDKKQRQHLLQMNQILAKQVMEMSKIVAVKALEELPEQDNKDLDDRSPDVELPIYQQRDNFFS